MLDTHWHSERATRGRSTGAGLEAPATIPDPPDLERPVGSTHKGSGCVSSRYTHPLRLLAHMASKRSGRAMECQALEQALPSPLGSLTSFHQALGSAWLTDMAH